MKHTKEQIRNYYASLREQRKEAKELSQNPTELDKQQLMKIQSILPRMSGVSYFFTKRQMEKLGFDGLPGIDCKTFQGWKECGFKVKKGEKSKISGLTWIDVSDEENSYKIPKVYHLFHRSQVEEIK